MVLVAPEDRDVLCFLRVDDFAKEFPQIHVFRFTPVVFGIVDLLYGDKFLKSICVDNITLGSDDEEELYEKSKHQLAEGSLI